jgi:two-component system nitrogen regulation response regulator GlnG
MAAIPRDLLESELFGHERGAFTGATERRYGRFEQANGGTLFLDEIGDMPMDLQTRLLRVLADGEYYRVGGREPVKADVRVIAATHQNLEQLVREKRFREDLFHRLNVIRIRLPALRERAEDIPLLLGHFLQVAAAELGVDVKTVQPDVEAILSRYPWPGNVRQLENTARWLTVMASGSEIHVEDLPPDVLEESAVADQGVVAAGAEGDWCPVLRAWADQRLKAGGGPPLLDEALPAFETVMIEAALAHTGGMKQEAAKLLGWGRNTLTRKMKDLRLSGDDEIAESA